ncbi:efflux transporter outer membrane subunit [Nitrospirillum pindoramense]|uniref:NodT family efflux transporter outer membrane factor (OMF) lipoprotein n=1 Tax=Nitrospirillum amazonense TaxID=28077 RepID=A0A560HHK9_9PROT|nr:efflux transporter outer membrane subunit [Nitrospirillum amazonense]TWB45943.1 NodT family efflux transporter outer membrane factor (OMF) lipoprotein [Nitrospirillum amazonense]
MMLPISSLLSPPAPRFRALKRCWLAGAAALALAGCSVGPDYQRPATPPPAAWQEAAPKAGASVWPAADWWKGFGSAQLDAYIAQAQTANDDLAAAMARVREADAQAQVAGAALLPSVGASADIDHQRAKSSGAAQTSTAHSLGLSASYELDFWGKNRATATAALATADASRYDLETVRLTVLSSVATSYFQGLELREQVRVAEDNLANAQATLDGLRRQADAGIATALDVAQQETTVSTLSAKAPPLRQQYRQSVHALAILLGQMPEAVDLAEGDTLAKLSLPAVTPGLPSELLARRPDVAQAEAQLRAANANITVARAAFFPAIDLTASGGYASNALSHLFDPGSTLFSLAAGLTQPIFQGGALEGQYANTQARYDELVATYRKSVRSAFSNVEDSLTAVRETTEQLARQEQATATARHAYELAQAQLAAGTITVLTVLNTETALFTANDALVQARYARLQALVGLYNALGGGWKQS